MTSLQPASPADVIAEAIAELTSLLRMASSSHVLRSTVEQAIGLLEADPLKQLADRVYAAAIAAAQQVCVNRSRSLSENGQYGAANEAQKCSGAVRALNTRRDLVKSEWRIYHQIAAERARQDVQHGGAEHDDRNDPVMWRKARAHYEYKIDDNDCSIRALHRERAALVKIAALAVAQVESVDRDLGWSGASVAEPMESALAAADGGL